MQFDIAEVYMEIKQFATAIKVLEVLVDSPTYSLAGVWLKKAECHRELREYHKSKLCYMQVSLIIAFNIFTVTLCVICFR